jgi:hypothetical protein
LDVSAESFCCFCCFCFFGILALLLLLLLLLLLVLLLVVVLVKCLGLNAVCSSLLLLALPPFSLPHPYCWLADFIA